MPGSQLGSGFCALVTHLRIYELNDVKPLVISGKPHVTDMSDNMNYATIVALREYLNSKM